VLPGLGFNEIVILAVLALVVIGPKDLPLMLRKLGRWTARLRAMANEFRAGFDELARQAELDELRKEVDALRRDRTLSDIGAEIAKPVSDIRNEIRRPIAPPTTAASVPPPAKPQIPDDAASVTEAASQASDDADAPAAAQGGRA
jgi:sec-independent protein translocase protein TatB